MERMLVEVYPIQVVIYPKSDRDLELIRGFARNYIRYSEYWDKWRKQKVRIPESSYVFFTHDRREVRILRTMLKDFIAYLSLNNFNTGRDYSLEYKEINNVVDDVYPTIKEGWAPRGEQQNLIDFVGKFDEGMPLIYLVGGGGKAENVDNLISTPTGWVRMGDLKVGDIIHNENGGTTTITGVFPQGIEDIYRVHFRDGRYSDVSLDHLWCIIDNSQTRKVKTTKEILEYIGPKGYRGWKTDDKHRGQYVPLTRPVEYYGRELKIDPYLLGVLIGDGGLTTNQVRIYINSKDTDIIDKIKFNNLHPDIYLDSKKLHGINMFNVVVRNKDGFGSNSVKNALLEYGLMNKRSWEKFIPEDFMYGTVEQRFELVRGLIDTDGYVSQNGNITYTTVSEKLANQVRLLIHSLGGMARINKLQKFYKDKNGNKVPGRKSYNVYIRHPIPSSLVHTKRKKERCNDNNQYAKTLKLQIMKIEKIGQSQTQCISVDNPTKLYVTSDYVVTHNSYSSMEIVSRKKERFVAIMRPTLIGEKSDEGWLKDFDKSFDISKDEIARVQGSDQLKKLIGVCVTRGYNPYKAVLISNKTLMNFVKYYEEYSLEEFYNLGYRCTPMEFPKVLGVNTFVIDEAHFDHHLNCRFASYFGLKRLIGATATPNFDDKFADRMVKLLFPVEMRYTQLNNSIHIQPISFHYTLSNPNRIRVEGFRGYNHIKFEQSLYKRKGTEEAYHEMIHGIVEKYHVPKYSINPNFKCLITVASIDAAKNLSEYLSNIYTNKKVTSYVDKDPVDNLYSSDICVSTVSGAGTGHDIPDLATVIMTNAINSSTANLQCAWRLRKMDYDVEHSFIYLVCDSIQAHKNYDIKKKNITFKGKTLVVKNDYSNIVIPC